MDTPTQRMAVGATLHRTRASSLGSGVDGPGSLV